MNLEQDDNGIWVARHKHDVSYPKEGNSACFAIEDSSFWFLHRNNVISELINQTSSSKEFYDIGGGNGFVSSALQASGKEVVLVEPGATGALNAKNSGVRTVIQSTLEDVGFLPESIPAAGLFDVVEHIENDVEFLRLIHGCLQPGGNLYITVPAYQLLWSNDDVDAGHYRRYTTKSLSSLLNECGFEVEYCSYLFSFLVPPIFFLRSIPSKIGLRKSVSQATTVKEHDMGSSLLSSIVKKLMTLELNTIKKGKRIRIGSSCIAVARKKT